MKPASHVPHSSVLPHPSATAPQTRPRVSHVCGSHAFVELALFAAFALCVEFALLLALALFVAFAEFELLAEFAAFAAFAAFAESPSSPQAASERTRNEKKSFFIHLP